MEIISIIFFNGKYHLWTIYYEQHIVSILFSIIILKARQGKFIYIAHFMHKCNSKYFT